MTDAAPASPAAPIITLLTDFGWHDAYAGALKGVILSRAPRAQIIDLTHGIRPQDVLGAAFQLAAAAGYFPPGTIHLAVVDPEVGTARALVYARARGQHFLAPDNGLLAPLLDAWGVEALREVANPRLRLDEVSATFHGRDILAPAAAHLAAGGAASELGPALAEYRPLDLPAVRRERDGTLVGQVVLVDGFGNLLTNIRREDLETLAGAAGAAALAERFQVELGESRILALSCAYADRPAGELVALLGSAGRLEVAVNRGSAAEYLGLAAGAPVRVRRLG